MPVLTHKNKTYSLQANPHYKVQMKRHPIISCTSHLFAREPSGLRSILTNELEWEQVQMLRSWFLSAPIGRLAWPRGPRPGSKNPPGDHASQPNAFKAWNSPHPPPLSSPSPTRTYRPILCMRYKFPEQTFPSWAYGFPEKSHTCDVYLLLDWNMEWEESP